MSENKYEHYATTTRKQLEGENLRIEEDMDQARKMLKEFSATYPESPLRIDAKKAIGELKAGASQSP